MWVWLAAVGTCQGVFALFTMYLPPLFPTLLRRRAPASATTFGRIAAAAGTVYFGSYSKAGDYRLALLRRLALSARGGICDVAAGVTRGSPNVVRYFTIVQLTGR